jgi:Ras-related protein Rab-1A
MSITKSKDYDYIFKIVLIGDTCVGKSCILVRFSDDIFNDSYVTTIGVDFRFKTMVVNNKVAKIQIWDTAGQERYRSITTAYYRGAAAIIICCDCTNKESFNNINNWIEEIGKYTDKDSVDKIVLMNKCDLVEERCIDKNEINKFEKESGIKVLEVSAKTGEGIDKAFEYVIAKLIDKNEKTNNNTMTLRGDGFLDKQGGCC